MHFSRTATPSIDLMASSKYLRQRNSHKKNGSSAILPLTMQETDVGKEANYGDTSNQQQCHWRERIISQGKQHFVQKKSRMRLKKGEAQVRHRFVLISVLAFVAFLCSTALVFYKASHPIAHLSPVSAPHKNLQLLKETPIHLRGDAFVCKNHADRRGLLNDDYCDCPDGSDEPHTSACSHLLVGKQVFPCDNRAGERSAGYVTHAKQIIFASRVKDGVVDCPGSSDELLKG